MVWCDLWVVSLIIMLVKYKRSQVPNYIVHKLNYSKKSRRLVRAHMFTVEMLKVGEHIYLHTYNR